MFLIKGKKVKGGRNMPITTLVLYLIYMIVGICTLRLLTKYKMKVARIAYAVASFVFMLYLPIYAGNELMAEFLSSLLAPFSCEPVVDALPDRILRDRDSHIGIHLPVGGVGRADRDQRLSQHTQKA